MNIKAFISSLLLLLAICGKAQDTAFPEHTGLVNDFENIFTDEQEKQLADMLKSFYYTGTGVIVVATIRDIGNYNDFNQYAIDMSNHWSVGDKDKNNGLTIIMSSNLRKVRITTGTGTQNLISDTFCSDVVQDNLIPHFKNGEYYEGLKEAIEVLMGEWNKH